jgi:hypothetical protein
LDATEVIELAEIPQVQMKTEENVRYFTAHIDRKNHSHSQFVKKTFYQDEHFIIDIDLLQTQFPALCISLLLF